MKYYVYSHYRKGDSKSHPFYIGKGSGMRCSNTNRSKYWQDIVNKYGYNILILQDNLEEKEAFDLEVNKILYYKSRGYCEANFTKGGDGVNVLHRWWGDKISKSMKGKNKRKGKLSYSYKDVITKDELFKLYVINKMSSVEIGKFKGISYATIIGRLKEYGIKARKAGKSPKRIHCLTDGKIFDSISDAAKYYGIIRENISKVLNNKHKHINHLNFKYYE